MAKKKSTAVAPQLSALQKKVLTLQDGLGVLLMSSAEKAWALGRALNELKEATPHGQWEPWCRENLRYTTRTVQQFMLIGTLNTLPAKAYPNTLLKSDEDPLRLQDFAAIASIAKREGGDVEKAVKVFQREQIADKKTEGKAVKVDSGWTKERISETFKDFVAPSKSKGEAPPPSRKVSMTREDAFKEIGITGSNIEVTEETIGIIFRGLMQKRHPDKGGTAAGFARLNNAKEILHGK